MAHSVRQLPPGQTIGRSWEGCTDAVLRREWKKRCWRRRPLKAHRPGYRLSGGVRRPGGSDGATAAAYLGIRLLCHAALADLIAAEPELRRGSRGGGLDDPCDGHRGCLGRCDRWRMGGAVGCFKISISSTPRAARAARGLLQGKGCEGRCYRFGVGPQRSEDRRSGGSRQVPASEIMRFHGIFSSSSQYAGEAFEWQKR